MRKKIMQVVILAAVGAIVYFFLSNHFFIHGSNFTYYEKSSLTLTNTFINVEPTEFRTVRKMLQDEDLQEAGVAEALVELEVLPQEEVDRLEKEIAGKR